ncbi:MAG: translation elongation factor Ts [Actinobacteria bacterium ATB1]|nr:translation elongation factor Ts [Actinobacteria bacterium ATB1]
MSISAADVKALREATGAGMMDCKKALTDAEGDIEAAKQLLREKGLAAVGKRADRTASEGLVTAKLSEDGKRGVMVELGSETDFVAKGERFGRLADEVAEKVYEYGTGAEVEGELASEIERLIEDASVDLQEKIEFRGAAVFEAPDGGVVAAYLHRAGGWAKKGVLVRLAGGEPDDLESVAYDLAMHIQFARPEYLRREDVPENVLAEERSIAEARALNDGKPDDVVPKIAEGAVGKLYKERVLPEQAYIKDEKKTVAKWLEEVAPGATIEEFSIFEVGAGSESD